MLTPADQIQAAFATSHPLAVGTSPMDALFAWLRTLPTSTPNGIPLANIERDLLKLQTLVLDINDDIDSQLQAQDLLATNNFMTSPQGPKYFYQLDDSAPTDNVNIFNPDQVSALATVNKYQARLNALLRLKKRLATDLFGVWWKRAALDPTASDQATQIIALTIAVTSLRNKIISVNTLVTSVTAQVQRAITELPSLPTSPSIQQGIESHFYRQRDPTIFLAGLNSQWPKNYDDNLTVRLNTQTDFYYHNTIVNIPTVPDSVTTALSKLPTDIQSTTYDLLREAILCDPIYNYSGPLNAPPQYYKNGDRYTGKQGWFPLFIEWEVEYYHITYGSWQ